MARENFMGVPYDAIRQMEEVYKGISKEPVLTTVLGVLSLTTNEFAPEITRCENSFRVVFEDNKDAEKPSEDPSTYSRYVFEVRWENEKYWFINAHAKGMVYIKEDNGSTVQTVVSLEESKECGIEDSPSVFVLDGLKRLSLKAHDNLIEIVGKFRETLNA